MARKTKTAVAMETAKKIHSEGRLVEAALLYKQIVADDPNNVDALYEWAVIASQRGNIENAENLLNRLLALNPHHAGALTKLGEVYIAYVRPGLARQCFEKALKADDTHLPAYDRLAELLINTVGDPWLAEEVCRKGMRIDADYGLLPQVLAKALHMQGRNEEAIKIYEQELTRHPEFEAENLRNIGAVYSDLALTEKAATFFERSIRLKPEDAQTHWALASVRKYTPYDAHITTMKDLLAHLAPDSVEAARLHFALGKAFDDIADYDTAFVYFSEGNRIVRATYDYDVSQRETCTKDLMAFCNTSFEDLEVVRRKMDFTPVFIVGMPRSGTTLVEQILCSHPMVAAGGEVLYLDQPQTKYRLSNYERYEWNIANVPKETLRLLRNEYIEKLRRHNLSAAFITDKMPTNYFYIGLIRIMFPGAKILHCKRDPLDNCFSLYRHIFMDSLPYAYDMSELARYYRCYRDLMAFWHERLPGLIHDVEYEGLVADQDTVTRDMLAFCGLPWDPVCLDFHKTSRTVITASAHQVKRPIYKGGVGAWRRYEKHLGILKRELEDLA